MTKLFRYWFRYCMDCGVKLSQDYNRGDVCKDCFEAFDGVGMNDIIDWFRSGDIFQ